MGNHTCGCHEPVTEATAAGAAAGTFSDAANSLVNNATSGSAFLRGVAVEFF